MFNWTHKELVFIAYKWAKNNASVGVVFRELYSIAGEIPDVIGFGAWHSVLIECKASRADFLKDKKKPHRTLFKGMGNWRFYCCPKGLIKVEELPAGWGLIYVDEVGKARIQYDCRIKRIPSPELKHLGPGYETRIVEATENKFQVDHGSERAIMYTALRRLSLRGRIDEIYKQP